MEEIQGTTLAQTTEQNTIQEVGQSVPEKIEIGTIPAVIGIVVFLVSVGIAWGTLKTLVKGIKETLDKDVKPDLKDVRDNFSKVEHRVETLWQDKYAPASSPRQLSPLGERILNDSGVKELMEAKKQKLLGIIKEKKPANAYDAEQAIIDVVAELPKHCPEAVADLKRGSFKVGQSTDTVLFVGAIHLRNLIFTELGFSLTDLDKPANDNDNGDSA